LARSHNTGQSADFKPVFFNGCWMLGYELNSNCSRTEWLPIRNEEASHAAWGNYAELRLQLLAAAAQ
jgi:hypothetical protein